MRKRRRLAVAQNVIRGVFGEPQLVSAGRRIHPPSLDRERSIGPVVVRASASLGAKAVVRAEGIVVEVTVPDTPERRAAALGTTGTGLTLGVLIAQLTTDGAGYTIIGALAGWWGSVRLWNRWVGEWDRWLRFARLVK